MATVPGLTLRFRLALLCGYGAAFAVLSSMDQPTATEAREPAGQYVAADFAPTKDFYARPFGLLSFNGMTRTARWTLERIDRDTKSGDRAGLSFHVDPEVPGEFAASPQDYAGSAYDIGHQAPARDHGDDIKATETVANACPQCPELNRGVWNKVEAYLYTFAHQLGVREVWILTAPAWIPEAGFLRLPVIGKNGVWVPTHCVKAGLVVFNDGSLKMLAWRFSNTKEPESIDEARISVDQAERDLGLDLWKALPRNVQDDLESRKPEGAK